MSEKLTRERIEHWREHLTYIEPMDAAEMNALCDLALSAADAEQRGRAQGLAEAVKVVEPDGPRPNCCEECARRWYVLKEKADVLHAMIKEVKP